MSAALLMRALGEPESVGALDGAGWTALIAAAQDDHPGPRQTFDLIGPASHSENTITRAEARTLHSLLTAALNEDTQAP